MLMRRIPGLQSTLALWTLGFGSELLFIGDSAGNLGPSSTDRNTSKRLKSASELRRQDLAGPARAGPGPSVV